MFVAKYLPFGFHDDQMEFKYIPSIIKMKLDE